MGESAMMTALARLEFLDSVMIFVSVGCHALSGYTFAHVAENHGMFIQQKSFHSNELFFHLISDSLTPVKGYHVCEYKAAAAAGAVFAAVSLLISLSSKIEFSNHTNSRRERENQ